MLANQINMCSLCYNNIAQKNASVNTTNSTGFMVSPYNLYVTLNMIIEMFTIKFDARGKSEKRKGACRVNQAQDTVADAISFG